MARLSKTLLIAAAFAAAPVSSAFAQDAAEPAPDGAAPDAAAPDGAAPDAAPAPDAAAPDAAPADAGGMYTKETWPTDVNARPLTLAKGMIEIQASVFVNLSADAVAKPFSISPDIWYGVSDKLSVGLTHGTGLCLAGEDNGCAKVYNDVGVNAKFSVKKDAKMEIALAGGLNLTSLDPMFARLAVGARIKYVAGKIGVYVDPTFELGLTERDAGNKESLGLPVKLAFQASPKLNAYVRTGIGGIGGSDPFSGGALLDGFGDNFLIPLGVGALFGVSNKIDVGAEFFFPGIAGSDLASTDARALIINGNIRL